MAQGTRGPGFTVTRDHVAAFEESLKRLVGVEVLIGVADDDQPDPKKSNTKIVPNKRKEGEMTNAQLAYIHETGSPINNIPARPFLNPGIKDSKEDWSTHLRRAGEAALDGNASATTREYNAAGMVALIAVKKKITAGIPPPLKPATVAARKRRTKSRKVTGADQAAFNALYAAGKATMSESPTTPLVDTAQMINSLTYTIRKKRK